MDEPTLVIQGRVTPDKLAMALQWLLKQGHKPTSRSEMVMLAFETLAALAEGPAGNIEPPNSNHHALRILKDHGIEWPVEPYRKDLVKSLAWDSMREMSMEGLLDLHAQAMRLNTGGEEHVTPSNTEGFNLEDLDKEFEEYDKEIKTKKDE